VDLEAARPSDYRRDGDWPLDRLQNVHVAARDQWSKCRLTERRKSCRAQALEAGLVLGATGETADESAVAPKFRSLLDPGCGDIADGLEVDTWVSSHASRFDVLPPCCDRAMATGMHKGRDGVIWRGLAKVMSLGAASLLSDRGSIAEAASGAGVETRAVPAAAPSSPSRGGASTQARDALARAIARREEWRRGREAVLREDFGETAHFRRANAALPPAAAGERRVVFIGDSITAGWSLERSFPGKGYINRGIGGQTTSQVLVRFRQDVIDLAPAAVVILLGTNDIAGNTGPIPLADVERNIASMAELAHAHQIAVGLSSVLPVHGYTPESETSFPLRPPAQIVALNRWLAVHAAEHGYAFIDYFTSMVDERGLLKKELATDGLHPNEAGYAVMAPLARTTLGKILSNAPVAPASGAGLR